MPGGSAAQRLGCELDLDVVAGGELGVERGERPGVGHPQRQMVQAQVAPAIERRRSGRLLGLPERDHHAAVVQEDGRVVRDLAHGVEAEGLLEEDAVGLLMRRLLLAGGGRAAVSPGTLRTFHRRINEPFWIRSFHKMK